MIVLSNNHGCIVAANKQAIALGIQKFQPFLKRVRCVNKPVLLFVYQIMSAMWIYPTK
jgi:DNA polymerase V